MATAMGAGTRPPDQGRHPSSSSTASTPPPRSAGTPAWAGARSASGDSFIGRPYNQIIAESTSTNLPILLQIHLFKVYNRDLPDSKPMNLSELHMSQHIFEKLKIPPTCCIELDMQTGRYEKRELLVSPNTDLADALTTDTPKLFRQHEVRVTVISNQATKVTFKGVPISVPNEEILHLCSHYGKLVDGIVYRQIIRLGGNIRPVINNSTRSVEVQLHPGKFLKNFYWLSGPTQVREAGESQFSTQTSRPSVATVSSTLPHPRLLPCLIYTVEGGNGKICKSRDTERTSMNAYIKALKDEGYTSHSV